MAQIIDYMDFIFDGVPSTFNDVYIISTDSWNTERIFGLKSSIETEDGIGDMKLFNRRKNDSYSFDVEIAKLDDWNTPKSVSEKEYDDIIRWLMTDEPKVFQVKGIVHFGTFISATEFHNTKRQGIIKLQFESIYPYAFSSIISTQLKINQNKTFKLENKSNINNKKVYLDIDIKKTSSSGSVTIKNKRINKYFTINNLELNEEIQIKGDGCFEILSLTNADKNLFNDVEYDSFPYLVYGTNEMEVIGDCKIQIKYQMPMALR